MAMTYEHATARFRKFYAQLLRFYPKPYHERFAESMEQTFNDLCRERREDGNRLFGFVFWIFVETFAEILRERITFMIVQNKNIVRIALVTGLVLLIPLVLTLLNPNAHINGGAGGGADWGPVDFITMGILLFGTGLALDFAVRKLTSPVYRMIACAAIVSALLLIWVELAVDGVSQAIQLIF